MTQRARRWAIGLALYLGAVLLGLGSAWWVLKKAPWMNTSVTAGAWRANMRAGSPDADMYTRASIAVNALLALGRDETMYFIASHDDAGQPLRSVCTYRIEGTPPQARWWSITAYAQDLFLFDAPNQHYSLNGSTAVLDAQGRFMLTTGPQALGDSFWLPTPGNTGVVLALRLYNPQPALQAAPASLQPPTIQRVGACP
ncbi:MAG: hypothetical protein CFE43_00360 [Burkholderiales bacterium PBB3]|nr:MAG: hypothetical protein CFE43_00360 [Burkholderiales bacterium PBB3]